MHFSIKTNRAANAHNIPSPRYTMDTEGHEVSFKAANRDQKFPFSQNQDKTYVYIYIYEYVINIMLTLINSFITGLTRFFTTPNLHNIIFLKKGINGN